MRIYWACQKVMARLKPPLQGCSAVMPACAGQCPVHEGGQPASASVSVSVSYGAVETASTGLFSRDARLRGPKCPVHAGGQPASASVSVSFSVSAVETAPPGLFSRDARLRGPMPCPRRRTTGVSVSQRQLFSQSARLKPPLQGCSAVMPACAGQCPVHEGGHPGFCPPGATSVANC
jgi:hypothetical protein